MFHTSQFIKLKSWALDDFEQNHHLILQENFPTISQRLITHNLIKLKRLLLQFYFMRTFLYRLN